MAHLWVKGATPKRSVPMRLFANMLSAVTFFNLRFYNNYQLHNEHFYPAPAGHVFCEDAQMLRLPSSFGVAIVVLCRVSRTAKCGGLVFCCIHCILLRLPYSCDPWS